MQRAARHGDAFVGAGAATTAQFAAQVALLREALAAAGRAPAPFPISKRVFIACDHKVERAERRMRGWCGVHYGNPDLADAVAVWGDRDRCVAQLQAIVDAGATHLLLNPVYNEFEHLEILATEVVPRLT